MINQGTQHDYADLIHIFHQCFSARFNTRLIKGHDEPIYIPAHAKQPWNGIVFAHGFFSSALHECAHWLIAGDERRKQVDYGYWYEPDGRNAIQQQLFQQVEVKPQALEWILSVACGYRFRLSIDNLDADEDTNRDEFATAIYQQVVTYCKEGLNERATLLREALCGFYGTALALKSEQFNEQDIIAFV